MRTVLSSRRQMIMLPYLFFYLLSPIFGLLDSEPHRVARFNNILSENWSDCDCEVFNEKIRELTYNAIDKSHHAHVYFLSNYWLWCVGCSSRRKQWSILLGIWPTSNGWQSISTPSILQIKHDFCFRDMDKNKTSNMAWTQTKHTKYSAPEVIHVTAQGHQGAKKLCRKLSA